MAGCSNFGPAVGGCDYDAMAMGRSGQGKVQPWRPLLPVPFLSILVSSHFHGSILIGIVPGRLDECHFPADGGGVAIGRRVSGRHRVTLWHRRLLRHRPPPPTDRRPCSDNAAGRVTMASDIRPSVASISRAPWRRSRAGRWRHRAARPPALDWSEWQTMADDGAVYTGRQA